MSYKDQKSIDGSFNTPLYLFNYLHKFFEFEVDPCDSGNHHLGLPYSYRESDNFSGLEKPWMWNTFVNPPYGKDNESKWIAKAFREYNKYGKTIFILLPAKTESSWFSTLMINADIIIFPRPRVAFIKNGKTINGNNIGSVIFGLRSKDSKGVKQLKKFVDYNIHELNVDYDFIGDNRYILYPDTKILKREFLGNIAS